MTEVSDPDFGEGAVAPAPPVGQQLRAAREARGLTVAQVAADTRISSRQLQKIEEGKFEDLPGRIYAVGFGKTYAKAVGLNQEDVADLIRQEMGEEPETHRAGSDFEPGDPAQVPSRRLVWLSVFAIALLLVGLYFAGRAMLNPAADTPTLTEREAAEQAAREAATADAQVAAAQPANPGGAVKLTAEGPVWLRVSDAAGARLMEGELAAGQSFTIPATAEGPKLITARPDLLVVTIGGRRVPKISDTMRTVSNEPLDAATLLARPRPTATPAANASGTPAGAATPAARPAAATTQTVD